MTLPIVESILLGELRPNHIEETVSHHAPFAQYKRKK